MKTIRCTITKHDCSKYSLKEGEFSIINKKQRRLDTMKQEDLEVIIAKRYGAKKAKVFTINGHDFKGKDPDIGTFILIY